MHCRVLVLASSSYASECEECLTMNVCDAALTLYRGLSARWVEYESTRVCLDLVEDEVDGRKESGRERWALSV